MDIALKEESRGCFTVPIAGEKGRWGQSSQGSKTYLRTTSSTHARKWPRTGPAGGALGSCGKIVLITYREGGQDNCIQRTITASTAEPSGTNWQPHGDKECFSGERGHCQNRSVIFKLTSLGSNCSFQGKQLLLAHGSLAGKFKCLAVIWDNRKVRQKHSSGQPASLLAGGPETEKRFFAISVLAVISKPKKEKQESTRSICLNIITRSFQDWELFCLKVPVFRSKRERSLLLYSVL